MADLASADVTVTLDSAMPLNPRINGLKRHAAVTMAFGDGAKTYPAGGVPLPGFASFGLYRNLDTIIMTDENSGGAVMAKYDQTNNKIRLFNAGAELGNVAVPAQTFKGIAVGW